MNNQVKKGTWIRNINNLKTWNPVYLKQYLCVCIVNDYVDTKISNFGIEYLRENEKVREIGFACSHGVQAESFKQKNSRKSRDTVPLSSTVIKQIKYLKIAQTSGIRSAAYSY